MTKYHPAFHTGEEGYIRCSACAALVADTDTATHEAFHELITVAMEAIAGHAREITQLQAMYRYLADRVIPEETRQRLAEPYKPTAEQLAEAREWREANFPGIQGTEPLTE